MFYYSCIAILLFFSTASIANDFSLEQLTLSTELETAAPKKMTTSLAISNTHKPLRLLIDVRSNHSDGAHDFQTLIQLAEKRHIDVLSFNEHDRFTIRLGLEPIPSLVGYSQEHPSLYETGVVAFFQDLQQAQAQTNITLMAGTESTPGYHWQGIPFKNLSLHNAERHLITLGANKPEQIQALPSYQLTYAHGNKELSLVFWFVFVFMLMFTLLRKRKRSVALLLAGSFIAFMTTWLMKPDANGDIDFIQTAQEQGLFTIWAHPGTLSGIRQGPMGVQFNTPPYNKHIFDYPADAFAAIYGDTDQNTQPNGYWDIYMMGYMKGYIAKPMWAVAAGDYHEEGQSREHLGNYPMDIWAKSAKEQDILAALAQGHMTAWHMGQAQDLSVHTLYLEATDPNTQQDKRLLAGDEASIKPNITLAIGIHDLNEHIQPLKLWGHWIVDGKIREKVTFNTPDKNTWMTKLTLSQGRHVIRFQIPAQQGIRLETNPFLVQVLK